MTVHSPISSEAAHRHARLQRAILDAAGYRLRQDATVLDFGCGKGGLVSAWRAAGYDAVGCDIALERETDVLRLIPADPYRLPFTEAQFDLVVSDQVLEHVTDHDAAFREMSRVLRPGGVALHIFPSRLRPIEPHTFVPLGGMLRHPAWLRLWAAIGVRNSFQRGKPWGEVAELNRRYLSEHTRYLSKRRLAELALTHFPSVRFAESEMLAKTYGRARHLGRLRLLARPISHLYGEFHMRVMLTANHDDGGTGSRWTQGVGERRTW